MALDHRGRTNLGAVRVVSGLARCPPLSRKVPAVIQFDRDRTDRTAQDLSLVIDVAFLTGAAAPPEPDSERAQAAVAGVLTR
jgi:hypothetical protein